MSDSSPKPFKPTGDQQAAFSRMKAFVAQHADAVRKGQSIPNGNARLEVPPAFVRDDHGDTKGFLSGDANLAALFKWPRHKR